ncbi:hypothetical protein [Legionella impletisoli]|uniref:Uncharacterized protein n=1 Tax=Legionella impletisoli TaxID=343510 RepID=A0A917JUY1_9GAMM|nr:hypothetical protein [Legionella impletisoli]GGI87449.1 hypothetical protein GCM10007966_15170 [Legionella impletisoli]
MARINRAMSGEWRSHVGMSEADHLGVRGADHVEMRGAAMGKIMGGE